MAARLYAPPYAKCVLLPPLVASDSARRYFRKCAHPRSVVVHQMLHAPRGPVLRSRPFLAGPRAGSCGKDWRGSGGGLAADLAQGRRRQLVGGLFGPRGGRELWRPSPYFETKRIFPPLPHQRSGGGAPSPSRHAGLGRDLGLWEGGLWSRFREAWRRAADCPEVATAVSLTWPPRGVGACRVAQCP
ncbi:hypothetical protein H8959_008369 [Pygathrix nigripes]